MRTITNSTALETIDLTTPIPAKFPVALTPDELLEKMPSGWPYDKESWLAMFGMRSAGISTNGGYTVVPGKFVGFANGIERTPAYPAALWDDGPDTEYTPSAPRETPCTLAVCTDGKRLVLTRTGRAAAKRLPDAVWDS